MYYLGELARVQIEDAQRARPPCQLTVAPRPQLVGFPCIGIQRPGAVSAHAEPLFRVAKGKGDGGSTVIITYEGEEFSIPRQDHVRTMHALSLVYQILNLQNKGTEVPTTSTVRVVP